MRDGEPDGAAPASALALEIGIVLVGLLQVPSLAARVSTRVIDFVETPAWKQSIANLLGGDTVGLLVSLALVVAARPIARLVSNIHGYWSAHRDPQEG